MQPASSTGADRSRQLRRWGPIGAVIVLVAVIVGLVLVTRDSDEDSTSGSTTPAAPSTTLATTVASTGSTTPTGERRRLPLRPRPRHLSVVVRRPRKPALADTSDWGTRCEPLDRGSRCRTTSPTVHRSVHQATTVARPHLGYRREVTIRL